MTAFYPTYKMLDRPPTPVSMLNRARRIGLEAGLRHVYTGNVPGDPGENTFCHACGALLIQRPGFTVRQHRLKQGACCECGRDVAGVWG